MFLLRSALNKITQWGKILQFNIISKYTCKNVDVEFHFSSGLPCHVFNILKQTFPSLYKFGLNRTVWFPVVSKLIDGGDVGYSFGK